MNNPSKTADDLSTDVINQNILLDTAEVDQELSKCALSCVLDSRRRLERRIEERQLEKDLRVFDFDI